MEANEQLDGRIAEAGGRTIAGLALESSATATSIRGDVVTDGPFIETKEALAGAVHPRGARPRPRHRPGPHDPGGERRRRGPPAARLPGRGAELTPVEQAVADAHRGEWAYVLAATVRVTRDLDTAEEAVQDAYVQALRTWGRERRARPARRLADHRGPAQRAQPGAAAHRRSRRSCRCWSSPRTTTMPEPAGATPRRDPRRPPAADLHLLPSGARPRGAGRPHAAAGVRRGRRPTSPGPSWWRTPRWRPA